MRAEDLFETIGDLDEELIARSEKSVRTMSDLKKKRKRRATIYRYVMIAASTAAVVFLFLLARDFVGPRGANRMSSSQAVSEESDALQESAEEQMMEEAAEAPESEAAEAASEEQNVKSSAAGQDAAASSAGQDTDNSSSDRIAESTSESQNTEEELDVEAAKEEAATQAEGASESESEEDVKEAVDLLGDLKGDYVKLEYISAADEAGGGERIIPEYTEEGEAALSTALDSGKARPVIMADTGQPVYYVYLTKENGEEHKITFYEHSYVSMDTIPGMVMKISNAEYEAVMNLFR